MTEYPLEQLQMDSISIMNELYHLNQELNIEIIRYKELTNYKKAATSYTVSKEQLICIYNIVGSETITLEEVIHAIEVSTEMVIIDNIKKFIKAILDKIGLFIKKLHNYNKYQIAILKNMQRNKVFDIPDTKKENVFNTCQVLFYKKDGFNDALSTLSGFNLREDVKTGETFELAIGTPMVDALKFFDWTITENKTDFNDNRSSRDTLTMLGWSIHDMYPLVESLLRFFEAYELDNKRIVKYYQKHIKKNDIEAEVKIIQDKLINVQKLLPILESVAIKITNGVIEISKDIKRNLK